MNQEIKNSNLYERITKNDFIYKAIYSLESYVFEKDLLDEKDYVLMLQLRDPFNHKIIDNTIKKVKKQIYNVLINDDVLEAQVYFRPKNFDKENKRIKYRPIHSASIITLITSVVLLNALLIETSKNDAIELTELAQMLPPNFYGNIPSERAEHLFIPWSHQFKEYTRVITDSYYKYIKTKEYKFEVTLDLVNFFPSINPFIIYNEILKKCSTKYFGGDFKCLKIILWKLLAFKITNLNDEKFKEIYYDLEPNCLNQFDFSKDYVWSKGIPQGLPHSYFFGNICMVKVAEIFQQIIVGKEGKAYYYVDDSVIYTNELKSVENLEEKIDEINKSLKGLSEDYINKNYIKDFECQGLSSYFSDIDKLEYFIEVHKSDDGKSNAIEIEDSKYGQANLNEYSRLTSMTNFDFNKIFSDSEEINIIEKLGIIYKAVEMEIMRISKEGESGNDADFNNTSNYISVLLRFKKFFKYRQKILNYSRNNEIKSDDIEKIIRAFKVDKEKENKFENFFEAYDKDILKNELRFLFENHSNFWSQIKKPIQDFNKEMFFEEYKLHYGEKELTVSYFHKICENLSRRKEISLDNNVSKYDSISRIVKSKLWSISKLSKDKKETMIKESIAIFLDMFKNGKNITKQKKAKEKTELWKIIESVIIGSGIFKNDMYNLICLQTFELYRIIMNAYFSEVVSVEINDLMHLAKKNYKPIYYNEARILVFLRNQKFRLDSFEAKFSNYSHEAVLDYKLFEVVDFFVKLLKDPVYIDNLILVHKYASDIWRNGSKYMHFYTLHNQEHAIELIKKIVLFIKSVSYFQISPRNFYILFISCYLHDISMVLHPNLTESFIHDNKYSNEIYSEFKNAFKDVLGSCEIFMEANQFVNYLDELPIKKLLVEFYKKLDQFYEDFVRRNHSKHSAKFIRESADLGFVEDLVKEFVAQISQAHGYNVDEIYKIKSDAKENLVSEKYIKILLRIGDLLDLSSNRISDEILKTSQKHMTPTTRFHWLSHKAISNVDIRVKYDLKHDGDKKSCIGPGSIIEKIEFIINLNIYHQIGTQKSSVCKINPIKSKECDRDKCFFTVEFDEEKACEECDFMCKWMKIKNEYLYKELKALSQYLNRSEANLFKTKICVKYKLNDNARRLKNSEYESILKYIENK